MIKVKSKTSVNDIDDIVSDLEGKGYFVLASKIEEVLGSGKENRRSARINSIKLAAKVRDRMEDAFDVIKSSKLLKDLAPDIINTLESDLDKLEDRISNALQDYLELKLQEKSDIEDQNQLNEG